MSGALFAKGLVFGFILAAAVGPMWVLCFRRTIAFAPPLTFGCTRSRNVAAPCGSRSHNSVRAPPRAAKKAKLTAAEVLPTPPLML